MAVGAVLAALIASPASGQRMVIDPCPQNTYPRDMLAAFLNGVCTEDGDCLRLWSYGLRENGDMMELFTRGDGLFAILTTTAHRCSTLDGPDQLHARLSEPVFGDERVPPPMDEVGPNTFMRRPLHRGHPL